nr:glycine cleavage system aminomethyltransferase GcvT [Thiolapillus sp.]
MSQACLRPRDRFWDIPVPKIDSAFDNLFVPQPSWSPSTTQQLRKLVAAPYLAPNDWTPRSEAYFVFPLAQGTPGKQCGLAATGVYQPSLRSPWLAADDWYRMVINAATTEKDIAWMERQAEGADVAIQPRRDLGMIAIQGPKAREKTLPLLPDDLREAAGQLGPFHAATNGEWFVGRTGYTGEDGFEVLLPENQVVALWNALAEAGVRPCGLGARDTLRLEAGMNLYGADMDEDTSPLESGLAWTVPLGNLERDFIGRSALVVQKVSGNLPLFTGLLLEGKGVLRNHQKLYEGEREVGEITSGGFSPTLQRAIGLARISADAGDGITVDIRGRKLPVRLVRPPFVRNGKSCI